MPLPPINLDPAVKAALARFRASRTAPSPLESALDAVVLVADIGGEALLTMDGRLLQHGWDDDDDAFSEITSTVMRRAVLVLGSQRVPELARVLPQRQEGAVDCAECGATGWLQLKVDFRIPCGQCGGMGWKDSDGKRDAG